MNAMQWLDNLYGDTMELKQPYFTMAIIVVLPAFAAVISIWYFIYKILIWRKYIINNDGGVVGVWARNNGYTVIELTNDTIWISNNNALLLYTLSKKLST